jgi:hypothetical protein
VAMEQNRWQRQEKTMVGEAIIRRAVGEDKGG